MHLLDEPTNDADIETLTELENLLDGQPGTLAANATDYATLGAEPRVVQGRSPTSGTAG